MTPLLAGIVDWLRPRGGWAPFLLTLVALLCMPAALSAKAVRTDIASLILLALLGLLYGLRLSSSKGSARSAAILGGLLGLGLVTLTVGRILPPLSLLWNEASYTLGWIRDWLQGQLAWPLPFSTVLSFAWQRAGTFGTRLWWWGHAVAGNTQTQDQIVVQLLTAFLVWAASLFAAWQIYRHHSPLTGLAPAGIIITLAAFFRGDTALFYLVVYLFCTLGLMAICRLWTDTELWDKEDTDYPDSLGMELIISYGPWMVMILVLAALFPVIYPHKIHHAFWKVAEEPWERIVDGAERFVGPIEDGYSGSAGYRSGEAGELPSVHLLSGGPELSDTIALYVTTSDPAPPRREPGQPDEPPPAYPHRYWRSRTYDTYTGQGWENGPLESRILSSQQALPVMLPPEREAGTEVYQQYQRLDPGETLLYAINAPYLSDSPVEAWERAPGDLAFFSGETDTYSILSYTPEPTALELQGSSPVTGTLPPEISERYLSLPDTVPQRVLDLAHDVAGEAPTRYERAVAIERFLRAYPYNLELPEPPTGRDLVDYFLFEQQEGYCDYYASAMVVMARAVGIPARLASGYAQGTYDHDARRWVVSEQDSHSWVEVYFDRIGWIEFEPTAGQPTLDRPGRKDAIAHSLPPLPTRTTPVWQRIPWGLAIIMAAALSLGALVVWLWRPRRVANAAEVVRNRQARLIGWGARLGHALRDGQTASEYAQSLGQVLRSRGRRMRWSRARRSGEEAPAAVEKLTASFIRAQYSPEPIPDREGWQVREEWTRLRRHLWRLWLARGLRKDVE